MRRPLLALFAVMLAACGGKLSGQTADDSPGDQPADAGPPSALGPGSRIHNLVQQLTAVDGGLPPTSSPSSGENEDITGASLIVIDDYDETNDGKSIGAVYVQDVGSTVPYSGIELYKPTYSPSNLLVAPGDVLDIAGLYQNYQYSSFVSDEVIPEMSEPVVTFRFEWTVPKPAVISLKDISSTVASSADPTVFAQGLRWESMLVEVDDVTLGTPYVSKGRVQVGFASDTMNNAPSIANQLMPIDPSDPAFAAGTHYSKVIGVCGFFFSFTISPRSAADLVK